MTKIKKWLVKFQRCTFGLVFDASDVPSKVRNTYNIVVLCTNNGSGLKPYRLLLPHQIYKKDLQEILAQDAREHGRAIDSIVAIPGHSEDYINLWEDRFHYGS